jgi:hypothetical protein
MAQTQAPVWENAIVGYRLVAPDQLLANPRNPRRHPNVQREALRASLRFLGWVAPVLQNVRTGHLIDGHARIEEALSAGVPEVPVIDVDLTPEQEAVALATLDPIAAMASRDREALDLLLREIDTGEQALMELLAREAAMVGLTPPDDPLAEWQGMPPYEHADQTAEAAFTIRVFLKDADDLTAFGRLLGRDLIGRKFIWFGKQPQGQTYEVYDGAEP